MEWLELDVQLTWFSLWHTKSIMLTEIGNPNSLP